MPAVQEGVAKALVNRGVVQGQSGEPEAAIATFDEVVERFGASDVPAVQELVAKALVNRGVAQGQSGEPEAAIGVERRAMCRPSKLVANGEPGQAAIATFDEVVERFGDSDVPAVQELVANALLNRGVAQGKGGEPEAAIATFDEVVERFGDSDVPAVQEQVANALHDKGMIQLDRRRTKEALRTCDELEPRIAAMTGNKRRHFEWRARWLRTIALVQDDDQAAMDEFHSIYRTFLPEDRAMMREMLEGVPKLIAAGLAACAVADILSSDLGKSEALRPLIVALHQLDGKTVRAPVEIVEVAADIRELIETRVKAAASPTVQ